MRDKNYSTACLVMLQYWKSRVTCSGEGDWSKSLDLWAWESGMTGVGIWSGGRE